MTSQASGSSADRRPIGRVRAALSLIVVGSLVCFAYNLVHPKGVLSLTRKAPAVAAMTAPVAPTAEPAAAATSRASASAAAPNASAPDTKPAKAPAASTPVPATSTPAKKAVEPAADAVNPPESRPAAPEGKKTMQDARKKAPPKRPDGILTPASPTDAMPATPPTPAPSNDAGPMPQSLTLVGPLDALLAFNTRSAVFVDARSEDRFKLGHIPGARNLPSEDFDRHYREFSPPLPHAGKVIVYCESEDCDQASEVCWGLLRYGYRNILYYKKGWATWEAAGYPQEEGGPGGK